MTAICPEAEELAQVQERSLPLLQEVKGEEEQVGKFEGLVAGDEGFSFSREGGRPAGERGEQGLCRSAQGDGAALGVHELVVVYLVRSASGRCAFPQER